MIDMELLLIIIEFFMIGVVGLITALRKISLPKADKKHLKEIEKKICRLQLFDINADIYTRIDSGLDYIKLGGNSTAKNHLMELARDNPQIYETVLNNREDITHNEHYFNDTINDINKLIEYKQRVTK